MLWCTLAWAFYWFAQAAVSLVRFPLPARWPQSPVAFLFEGAGFLLVTTVVLSGAIVTLLVVPYAFVVARRPERRFWGEAAPLGRVVLWLAMVFAPLGVLLGATHPPLHTAVTGSPAAATTPAPAPPSKEHP